MAHTLLNNLTTTLQKIIAASPLQSITHPLLTEKKITLAIKRDDLLHPDISGNKWRKLKYNLIHARKNNIQHVLSFGGAYSNHIHALAAAGFYLGFRTSAIIRGEAHYANNPTLAQAQQWGMTLHFVTRKEYRERSDSEYLQQLQLRFPDALILPEGGSNAHALLGIKELCQEIIAQTDKHVDHVITATGSAGTLSGLISGFYSSSSNTTKVTGIAVLKDAHYLRQTVQQLLASENPQHMAPWQLHTQFHGGGYAKVSPALIEFCSDFEQRTHIPIEPIYTGKMLSALFELIKQDYFTRGEHIVALHTGGLQGRQGLGTAAT